MNVAKTLCLVLAALLVAGVSVAQEKMTKEQWQNDINSYTAQRTDLQAKIKAIDAQIATLKTQSQQSDDEYTKQVDALYALVGSNRQEADAYRTEIAGVENTAADLSKLSDADLLARSGDVDALAAKVKSLHDNKLSLVPEFYDRLAALGEKVQALQTTLANQVKIYTVGTWKQDRDCLWNIAKKKDIYDNAWLWPKIWQGNRDQIKDPDVIHQGQKLKIPKGNALEPDEKAAARKYYGHHKSVAAASAKSVATEPAAK
jgi:nucleoid-associated protein YgaU